MTENEAIEELHGIRPYGGIIPQRRAEALDVAIKALKEVQQYRAIGTPEDFLKMMTNRGFSKENLAQINCNLMLLKEYTAIGTPEELQKAEKEENILKFYYCDSEDSYLIGRRVGNFYYAHYLDGSWVFDMSRYLPWGIYINGREYPSEPREINFSEWLKGFVKKECGGTPEECRAAMEKQTAKRPSCDSFDGLHFSPICPNCGGELDEDERESYCECGQKLDWSDEQ